MTKPETPLESIREAAVDVTRILGQGRAPAPSSSESSSDDVGVGAAEATIRADLLPKMISATCPSCGHVHEEIGLTENRYGGWEVPIEDRYVECDGCGAPLDIGWVSWPWHEGEKGPGLVQSALAQDEVTTLKQWVADLQSGMFINCVYCGHRYGPGETRIAAEALTAHIAVCPNHPMSGLLKACTAASHALRSYQYGNASTDLAKSVADSVDAAVAAVGAGAAA